MLGSFKNISVGIVNLGSCNLFSIYNAFKDIGYNVKILNCKKKINVDILVLPGVGSFPVVMGNIKKNEVDLRIFEHVEKNKIIFGICLGMQLLFDGSFEFGFNKGLSLLKGNVKKIKHNLIRVPNIGWCKLENIKKNSFIPSQLSNKYLYFVHSFYCDVLEKEDIVSFTSLSKFKFCNSVQKKKIIGTQFHPEKSGELGIKILKNLKNFI